MQRTSDQEILSALGHGERKFGWDEWFGDVDGADYLTDRGKQAARQAIADLTQFFGDGWLSRAIEPGPDGAAIPILGRYAPLLALAPAQRPRLYVESIRWWASLQTLAGADVGGLAAVRRDARRNLTTHRLVHSLTQARLASIGMYLGGRVELEPGASGSPGDVLTSWPGHDVFFEVVTFGPDYLSGMEDQHHNQHFLHLLSLSPAEPIYWKGDIPGFLNKTDEATWIQATTDAATRCAQTGEPVEIPRADGTCLVVRPGAPPPGTATRGPYVETDDGARLARRLDQKGAQTRGAGTAWIWVEDYGGFHPLSDFAGMAIDAKLRALADLAGPVLADRPHLAGIIWSAAQWCSPVLPDAQTAGDLTGAALQRALPIERVRQSIILNRRLILPGQTAKVLQICDAESSWLDWALAQVGITGGVNALLTQPPQAPKSRLWVS
jgi:hypothetical protein